MNKKTAYPPPPTENQIGRLLESLHPEPGSNFYSQLEKAPWRTQPRRAWRISIQALSYRLALTAVFLAIIIWAAWPGLEALARQVTIFFLQKSSDALIIELSTPAAGDILIFQPNFELSQSEALAVAGFELLKIFEPGLNFQGATYDSTLHSVMQFYKGAGYNLYLVQRLQSNGPSYFSIGASASIETLNVRGVPGEYVTGGWKDISINDPAATPDLLQATWDPDQSQKTLRWSENEFTFELRCHGDMCPSQVDLVNLANQMR